MSALSLAQVLWDERLALAGKPLHFPPAHNPEKPSDGPGASSGYGTKGAHEQKPQECREEAVEERPIKIADIYLKLNEDNRWALCLSGGGIRSAAFSFGILQRFGAQSIASKHKIEESGSALQQFEYLSTVSGGGYIGSWLSAWLFQERKKYADAPAGKAGGTNKTRNANEVVAALNQRLTDVADGDGRIMDHAEVGSISNLRRDSHYLAPSFSALSPDLWSDFAGIVRNLCLNWILLVPPMILAVLTTKALSYAFIDSFRIDKQSLWFVLIMIMSTLCFILALSFSAANRPARGLINASQEQFLKYDMAIFLFAATLLVFILGSPNGQTTLSSVIRVVEWLRWIDDIKDEWFTLAVLIRGAILGVAIYAVSWFVGYAWSALLQEKPQPPLGPKTYARFDFFTWCGAGAVFGLLIAAGLLLLFQLRSSEEDKAIWVGVCGLPWIVLARVIADVVFIAFAEFIPGADAGLEYQARSGGIFMLAQLGWLIWFGLVLVAPPVVNWLELALHGWVATSLIAAGGLSGAFSVIVGASSKTAAIIRQASGLREYFGLNSLAAIAAAIFAIVLVVTLSLVIDWALLLQPSGPVKHPSWMLVFVAIIVLVVLIAAASYVISINRYSLHSIYRNRLVRAFLGASRDEDERDKTKNAFTDFDSRDSPLLQELWEHRIEPRGAHWKPLHVINAALNLVSSKNLAWQERMAAPFTFSPLHCGSGSAIFPDGAYRASYATGQDMPYGGRLGLTLGTAMAISGAAVSPNMGYNSSPGVGFLMALFNVRLGWWIANPRGDNPLYWRTKPRVALWPFFMEMFGLTSETARWVYLSDGGHFENLGIYEMVRRRCRVIVVSDAGCDPEYTFDDLGNALRKIWIDLGVRIDLHGLDRLKKRFKQRPTPATEGPYWAIGDILYSEADGANAKDGLLLYFKAGLRGTEPMDVLSYAMSHTAFPHESTANQFFTESQFESYRMLGYEIAERAFESCGCSLRPGGTASAMAEPSLTLDVMIERLKARLVSDDPTKRTNGSLPSDKALPSAAGNTSGTSNIPDAPGMSPTPPSLARQRPAFVHDKD